MSGIFGIFNLDGKPVTQEALDRMIKPMAYWGPDGQGTWREGPVGLGQLMLHNTPESIHEKLPMKSRCGNFVISASARIDNREKLLKVFNIPFPEHPFTTDSALILEAYKKWGDECPDHLLGDWSCAIWDVRKRRLFIARDHHGNTSLYYFRSSRFFAFSSCVKGLFTLPEIPLSLNEMRVVRRLVNWSEHGTSTFYNDIFRLPPAHLMTVGLKKFNVKRYWYLEDTPRHYLKSDQEYVDAFLEIYTEAVRCRLRSLRPIGVSLSGGLDSGSVAALAAREMQKRGETLQAFSSVPIYDVEGLVDKGNFGDETPYIKATAEYAGNIDVTFVRGENVTPLKGIERFFEIYDEPIRGAANAYWCVALLEEARNRNIGTLLTGQGGNGTVSWHAPGYIAQLAREKQWKTLWKELQAWRHLHQKPLWRAVLGRTVKPLILQPLMGKANRFRPGRKEPWEEYSAINRNFANRLNLTEQMYKSGHDPTFGIKGDIHQLRLSAIKPGKNTTVSLWQVIGASFAMEVRDPTTDKRIMEFCLSIPDNQYFREGKDRFLIRRAMEGILPPKVRLNTCRGRQGADIGRRLCKSKEEIKSALESIEKSELVGKFLDIKKLWDILLSIERKVNSTNTRQAGPLLLRGLAAGLFLLRFEK